MHKSIAIFVNDITRIGGTEVITKRLAKELSKLGHRIKIVTARSNSEDHSPLKNIEYICYSSTNQFLEILKQQNKKEFALLFTDIPHEIHNNEEFRRRFYKTLDNISASKYLRLRSPQSIEDLISLHGRNRLYNHFDCFIAQSHRTMEISLALFGGKCVEIPNGVPLDKFGVFSGDEKVIAREKYGIPANAKVYLYVGRYLTKKGFEEIQKGWREWKNKSQNRESILLTVGYNPTKPENDYSDRQMDIIDLGLQSEEEVVQALHTADFFLFPSRNEGLSNALIEALACGVIPIVYKNISGTECIDDTVAVFLPDSENYLNNIVAALEKTTLINDSQRESFSRRSRTMAEQKYGIKSVCLEYSRIIDGYTGNKERHGFQDNEGIVLTHRSRK